MDNGRNRIVENKMMLNGIESVVTDIRYVQRGYEDFHIKLAKLGANIQLVEENEEGRKDSIFSAVVS